MESSYFVRQGERIKDFFLLLLQRLWITFELFNRNGLTNHAGACAYGFLLSAAPALLFLSFVVSHALSASPELVEALLEQLGHLFGIVGAKDIVDNFLSVADSGF